jgi:hypothetical protein
MEEEPLFKTNTGKEDMNEYLRKLGLKKAASQRVSKLASQHCCQRQFFISGIAGHFAPRNG